MHFMCTEKLCHAFKGVAMQANTGEERDAVLKIINDGIAARPNI